MLLSVVAAAMAATAGLSLSSGDNATEVVAAKSVSHHAVRGRLFGLFDLFLDVIGSFRIFVDPKVAFAIG